VQGVLAGIGFWIAGIKAAPLLGFVTFLLSPVPIGPPLVWIPAGLYLINTGAPAGASLCCLWGAAGRLDDRQHHQAAHHQPRAATCRSCWCCWACWAALSPFGFIGVFLGPVLLALGYALLNEWATHEPAPENAGDDADADSAAGPR
jgi:predicted PurR-regulated permease PerM